MANPGSQPAKRLVMGLMMRLVKGRMKRMRVGGIGEPGAAGGMQTLLMQSQLH
jgi:hypothetical protein